MPKSARFWSALLAFALLLPAAGRARAAEPGGTSWLGVYTQEITPELREGLDYNGQGVIVSRVISDSPAERAGIQRGDVITRVGTRAVRDPEELAAFVRSQAAGRPVPIEVVRDGQRRVLRATLSEHAVPDAGNEEMAPPSAPDAPEAPEAPEPPAGTRQERRIKVQVNDQDIDIPDLAEIPNFGPGVMMLAARGRLGVRIESLNPDLASYFGSRDAKGALVLDVVEESPAEKAGIRPGDVIMKVGADKIESAQDLVKAVSGSDGSVSISLLRHGANQTVEVALGPKRTVTQLHRGVGEPEGFVWKEKPGQGRVREFSWNQRRAPATGRQGNITRRIVINGDEARDELRQEIEQLRQELKDLRREMESGKEK